MRGQLPLALLATSLLIACDHESTPDSAPPPHNAVVASVAAAAVADTTEDSTCDLAHAVAHADPDSLIMEYLAYDAAGQFLQSDPWFDGATECPGHEAGPDSYTVIKSYDAEPLTRSTDTVSVVVTSLRLGRVSEGFTPDSGTVVDTVGAVRTPYGWRIIAPALRLFISHQVADKRGDLVNAPLRPTP